MAIRGKLGVALRDMHESLGDKGTVETVREMLQQKKLRPEDFSLQEMWHAFERDVATGMVRDYHEAVSSDMFPTLTGEIINAKLIAGYDGVQKIGDRLCDTVPSNMEVETFGGFTAGEGPDEVGQGMPYNDSTIGEKYVTIPHVKKGRTISVTEEAIYFDKTGQILKAAKDMGIQTAQDREKVIVEGVQDVNSNVFRPAGVAAAFYRTSASGQRPANSVASTPFGEAGVEAAMKLFHNMTNDNGDLIIVNTAGLICLVPFDLWVVANQLVGSALVPETGNNAMNVWKGMFTVMTSPYITAQSTSTWYLGDFKTDFIWSEIWPLQTSVLQPGSIVEFTRDIKAMFKVRYYGQIGAIDDRHCLKMTA